MAESKPLKINPKGLKLLHENLEKIGQEMDMVVDEEPHEIEAVEDDTEKIIKENVIDKTKRILRPEERKRFLAIGQIFMDEWLSQIRAYQANERKVGLLTGAISMLKKKLKGGADKLLHIFKFPKFEIKKPKGSWVALFGALAAVGVGMFLFWDDIKKSLPKEVVKQLEAGIITFENAINPVIDALEAKYQPIIDKKKEEIIKGLDLDGIWRDYVELYLALRNWSKDPWDAFLKAMGLREYASSNGPILHHTKANIAKAKEIVAQLQEDERQRRQWISPTSMSYGLTQPSATISKEQADWAVRIVRYEEEAAEREKEYKKRLEEEAKKAEEKRIKDLESLRVFSVAAQFNNNMRKLWGKNWDDDAHELQHLLEDLDKEEPEIDPWGFQKYLDDFEELKKSMPEAGEFLATQKIVVQEAKILYQLEQISLSLYEFFRESEGNFKIDVDDLLERTVGKKEAGRAEKMKKFIRPNKSGKIRQIFMHYRPGQTIPLIKEHIIQGKMEELGDKSLTAEHGTVTYDSTYQRDDGSKKRIINRYTSKQVNKFNIEFVMPDSIKINTYFDSAEQIEIKQIQELRKHNQYLSGVLLKMNDAVNKMNKVVPA